MLTLIVTLVILIVALQLRLSDKRDQSCEDVDRVARAHLTEVERKIADLAALGDELRQIIGRCGHGTVAECRIIEALSPA